MTPEELERRRAVEERERNYRSRARTEQRMELEGGAGGCVYVLVIGCVLYWIFR